MSYYSNNIVTIDEVDGRIYVIDNDLNIISSTRPSSSSQRPGWYSILNITPNKQLIYISGDGSSTSRMVLFDLETLKVVGTPYILGSGDDGTSYAAVAGDYAIGWGSQQFFNRNISTGEHTQISSAIAGQYFKDGDRSNNFYSSDALKVYKRNKDNGVVWSRDPRQSTIFYLRQEPSVAKNNSYIYLYEEYGSHRDIIRMTTSTGSATRVEVNENIGTINAGHDGNVYVGLGGRLQKRNYLLSTIYWEVAVSFGKRTDGIFTTPNGYVFVRSGGDTINKIDCDTGEIVLTKTDPSFNKNQTGLISADGRPSQFQ